MPKSLVHEQPRLEQHKPPQKQGNKESGSTNERRLKCGSDHSLRSPNHKEKGYKKLKGMTYNW